MNTNLLRIKSQVGTRKAAQAGALLACLILLAAGQPLGAQTYSLNNTWAFVGTTNNLDTANDNRGMTYGLTNQVIVNNKGTHVIALYDGTTGISNGAANVTGVSGGNFTINKLGVGTDGVLYGANLNVSISGSSFYKLYSWSNWTVAPLNCYSSSASDAVGTVLSGKRLGDTFAITGGGTNTMILAGVGGINDYVLLSTSDGIDFTSTVLTVTSGLPSPGSGVQFGLAFYTNNTFMIVPAGGAGSMYLVQFPANFASLTSPVTATVIATNNSLPTGNSGNWLDLSYNSQAGLLATHPNASSPITLYKLPANNFAGLSQLASTNLSFSTSQSANGNETGDVALGGAGGTNAIYTLDTSAGLQATAIAFAPAPVAPVITTAPVGGSIYTNTPSFTLSVVAQGSLPLLYQWQFNTASNLSTATNILGATNASYTLAFAPLSASGYYDVVVSNVAGATSSVPVLVSVSAPASSLVVTQLWQIPPDTTNYPFLDSSSYDTRGLAYDSNTMTVLLCDKGADLGIYVLDANTGTNLFALNTLGVGVAGDQFPLDQVGVGDDGVVYACNLTLAGSAADFAIFSWSDVSTNATPEFAFQGDPGNGSGDRWGDTMAVRGAGVNTEILLGSYTGFAGGPGTNVALLKTSDGVNFTATTLTITNLPATAAGFSSLGIAFGAGNTFWAKSPGYDLRQIAFDPVSGNAGVINDFSTATSGASSFSSMSAIGVDPGNNIVAGVTFNDIPNNLSLYQVSTNGIPPYLFDQTFFPSLNGNIQNNGATAVKFPRIYSLDVNNGVVAVSYGVPPAPSLPPFSISAITESASVGATITWQSYVGHSYQVYYKNSLTAASWTPIGPSIIASAVTTSYTDTTAHGAARFYLVQGH